MARTPKLGETIPLSVVRKENEVADNMQSNIKNAADAVENAAGNAMDDIAAQLRALKEQVQALQATTSELAAQTGKVMASGARIAGDKVAENARIAGDKVAENARIAGDKAVAGARVAGEKVSATVENYPISALLIASGVAFLLGRMSTPTHHEPSFTESTLDSLRGRLHDLSSRLPPHMKSALRNSLR